MAKSYFSLRSSVTVTLEMNASTPGLEADEVLTSRSASVELQTERSANRVAMSISEPISVLSSSA